MTQPVMGYLIPYEWQEPGEPMNGVPGEPMNGAFDDESPYVVECDEEEQS